MVSAGRRIQIHGLVAAVGVFWCSMRLKFGLGVYRTPEATFERGRLGQGDVHRDGGLAIHYGCDTMQNRTDLVEEAL